MHVLWSPQDRYGASVLRFFVWCGFVSYKAVSHQCNGGTGCFRKLLKEVKYFSKIILIKEPEGVVLRCKSLAFFRTNNWQKLWSHLIVMRATLKAESRLPLRNMRFGVKGLLKR